MTAKTGEQRREHSLAGARPERGHPAWLLKAAPRDLRPAYRPLLIAAAAVLVARSLFGLEPYAYPEQIGDTERLALVALGLLACATSMLTLNFPGRPNVAVIYLASALAWWKLGLPAAIVLTAFGALFGSASRRALALGSFASGARVALATAGAGWFGSWAGQAAGIALDRPDEAGAGWVAAFAAFLAAAGAIDWVLDWLDRRWLPAAGPSEQELQDRLTRSDLVTNLLLLPLLVLFQLIDAALGFERLVAVLGGTMALLFVVRASINVRTLHDSLQRLHSAVVEEREKLATIFEHSGDAIYTVDDDLRITAANRAMADLLGVPLEQVEGQQCFVACHYLDAQGTRICPDRCPLRQAQAAQHPISQEVIYQAPGADPKHLLLTYAAVGAPNGPLALGIGIAHDITAQKEVERLREEFVSVVTHEMRSPLTVSLGYLDLLKRTFQRDPAAALANPDRPLYYTERIEGAERHLLRLVDNLLEMARVERPDFAVELGEVNVTRLLGDAIEGIATVARAKQQTVRLEQPETPIIALSSELFLREIISNLLSNAVKYTPIGGSVTARVRLRAEAPVPDGAALPQSAAFPPPRAGQRDGGLKPVPASIEIAISDTGYGMSEEELAQLFNKFFRSGRPEIRKERGTGLGLALVKRMVERLGGTIRVESTLGKGSTFTVLLPHVPATRPSEQERVRGAAATPAGRPHGDGEGQKG